MSGDIPRIEAVSAIGSLRLRVFWRGMPAAEEIDLSHWVASGGDVLAPLSDPNVFAKAAVDNYGAAVTWDSSEGDLSIDAINLARQVR